MIFTDILLILVTSLIIYFAGERFGDVSSWLGNFLGMSKSTKGATLDAVSSSAPELSISLISVLLFGKLEFGIGTIVGSALFNLILIPALCVFMAPLVFEVDRKVIHRDGLFYILTLMVFLGAIFYADRWSIWVGLIFVSAYGLYIFEIYRHGTEFYYGKKFVEILKEGAHRKFEEKVEKTASSLQDVSWMKLLKKLGIFFGALAVIIGSSYFLVESSIGLAEALHVPAILIAFTVAAAASSLPDLVISVANARKGSISDATSNVIGSNIFDVLIGLGLPILLANLLRVPTQVSQASMTLVFALLVSSVVVVYFFAENMKLTKPKAVLLLLIYAGLVAYVVLYI